MKKRLIFFIGTLQAGGAERVISELTRVLVADYEITIILYYNKDIFYDIDNRVHIVNLERKHLGKSLLKKAICFRNYVQKHNPDLVISFLTPFNIFSYFVLIGIKCPLILCERSDPRHYSTNIILKILRNLSYSLADGVIFQTYMGLSFFSSAVRKHSILIPNPRFVSKDIVGKGLRVEKESKIVTVARLTAAKNLPMLINAFNMVYSDFPNYQLVIYGDGEEREPLQKMIDQLGLGDRVVLYGKVKNIYDYISSASLFVLSSDFEGMSNALMEAISLGLPVISTNVSGAAEMVINGVNGFLIDTGDVEALTIAMRKILIDPELRKRMGQESVKLSNIFDFENVVVQWKSYIEEMINK